MEFLVIEITHLQLCHNTYSNQSKIIIINNTSSYIYKLLHMINHIRCINISLVQLLNDIDYYTTIHGYIFLVENEKENMFTYCFGSTKFRLHLLSR